MPRFFKVEGVNSDFIKIFNGFTIERAKLWKFESYNSTSAFHGIY